MAVETLRADKTLGSRVEPSQAMLPLDVQMVEQRGFVLEIWQAPRTIRSKPGDDPRSPLAKRKP